MSDSLTIIDNRTGKKYELPVQDGTIRAMDLRQIKAGPDDFGLMTYDPAFMNTANCRSAITYIDGDKGILLYRGYPIEELAEHSDYLETAYLIVFGSVLAYTAYTWLLQHASVSRVATYAFVNPVVAIVLGTVLLNEEINLTMVIGAAMIVVAVAVVVRTESQSSHKATEVATAPTAPVEAG